MPRGLDGWSQGTLTGDPINSLVIYATARPGLFRSIDAGMNWSLLYAGAVSGFSIDPRNGSHLLLTDVAGALASVDAGATWARLTPFPPLPPEVHFSRTFPIAAIDPFDDRVYFVADLFPIGNAFTEGSLYKSVDGGETWTMVFRDIIRISALVFDRSAPGTLFMDLFGKGILRSGDAGLTWQRTLDKLFAEELVSSTSNSSILYAGVRGEGVFKFGPTGWQTGNDGLGSGFDALLVRSLTVAPSRPDRLFVTTPRGLFRSDDGAAGWQLFRPDPDLAVVAIDPMTPDTFYLRRGSRLLKTVDDGLTLRDSTAGILAASVGAMLPDLRDPSLLYAAQEGEVAVSSDGATTWIRRSDGLPLANILGMAQDAFNPHMLYAATQASGIYKSLDGGAHWSAAGSGLTGATVSSVVVDPILPGVAYATASNNAIGIFKTEDGGANWKALGLSAGAAYGVAVSPSVAGVVYVAADTGVHKSSDAGTSWVRCGTIPSLPSDWGPYAVAIDPVDSNRVYAATLAAVFRSLDGGATWSLTSGDLLGNSFTFVSGRLVIDPLRPTRIYATDGARVLESLDGATRWTPILGGLPLNASISSLAIGPTGAIFAGTDGFGVFSAEPMPDRPSLRRTGPRAPAQPIPDRR